MKASAGFAFFLLFLGGFALVNLRGMSVEADFRPPTIDALSQHPWRPSHIGEMPLDNTTPLRVQFDAGGSITGYGGCNRFFGRYTLDGALLEIDALGMSRMVCPESVMSIEFAFVDALQSASTLAMRNARMAISDDHGVVTARFDSIAPTP